MKHENTRRLANLLAEGRSFWLAAAAGLAFAALLLTTAPARAQEGAGPLRIGGKNFTEQLILSSMTTQYLKAKGIDATLTSGLGSTLMRQAMESGQLDVVWDYTGTALIVFNKVEEKARRPGKLQAREGT